MTSPQRLLEDALSMKVDSRARVRLGLQRRARANLRRSVRRDVVRFLTLVVTDLAAFGLMREMVRAVRDAGVLGGWLSQGVGSVLPLGYMNGWQFPAALFVGLLVLGNYGPGDRRRDPGRLFLACALATALPLWSMLWERGLGVVLLQYSVTVVLVWLGVLAERVAVNRIIARVRFPKRQALDTLFVGSAADCKAAAASPAFGNGSDYRTIGFLDLQSPPAPGALGTMGDLGGVLAAAGPEVVVICGFLTADQLREVVDAALTSGCSVLSAPRVLEVAGVLPATVWRQGQPLVELTARSLKGHQRVVKRAIDVVGSLLGLVLLVPLFAVVALLVKLDSRGPVFFRQERVGRGGRVFRIIKLRTMVDGAEGKRDELLKRSVYRDARLFKVPHDPRRTRLGVWLRRTSLDELPQLANVLWGDMSLVGPRPPLPSEVALYEAHHYTRFDVNPGMTGPWQVAGRNAVTDFETVVGLEQQYVRTWSLVADLRILLRTIPAVLRMRGAL